MKRALAVLLAFVGFSAFGIGTFSGKWEASVGILPSITLSSTLTLNYSDFGWTFSGAFKFGATGLVKPTLFTAKGALGPFSLTARGWFDPVTPAWMGGDLATSLDFAGMSLGFTVRQWVKGYAGDLFGAGKPWYPDTDPCQTYDYGMMYIVKTKVDPVELKVRFVDCCTGIAFYDTLITVKGIGLCCGISLDSELSFTKAGFDYISFSGIKIPLCCGVSITASVKFTTGAKEVTTGFEFAGFGDACFTVYGDALGTPPKWEGIEIYGWKIKCALGDCSSVEFLTALDPETINTILGGILDTENCEEYEYMALNFCGAGCCGGQYSVSLKTYFGTNGGLFDLTRLVYDVKIPVMSNFTLNLKGSVPAASCAGQGSLTIGWTFTF